YEEVFMISATGPHRATLVPAIVGFACLFGALGASAEAVKTVNGETIDSAVLNAYIENRANKPLEQVTPQEREAFTNELTDIYLLSTQDSAKEREDDPDVAAQLELQKRGVLAQAAAEQFLTENQPSEEEIQAEYQEQVELAPREQYKARHILVESQAKAQELIAQLDSGANFEELAKQESSGPSAGNGGDVGWFSPDQMVKPFADAVASLEDGAYTKAPVKTEFGWHVIK